MKPTLTTDQIGDSDTLVLVRWPNWRLPPEERGGSSTYYVAKLEQDGSITILYPTEKSEVAARKLLDAPARVADLLDDEYEVARTQPWRTQQAQNAQDDYLRNEQRRAKARYLGGLHKKTGDRGGEPTNPFDRMLAGGSNNTSSGGGRRTDPPAKNRAGAGAGEDLAAAVKKQLEQPDAGDNSE